MGAALSLEVTLTSIDCGQCGGTYAINERYRKQCKEYGRSWHCPYCRTGWGYSKGEIDELREKLDAERNRHSTTKRWLENEQNSHRATRGQVTKLKKRASAGVCPCCNRTFSQLARHMKMRHPDFGEKP